MSGAYSRDEGGEAVLRARIPVPPTTNNLFFNLKNGGRARSTVYKAWLRAVGPTLRQAFTDAGAPAWGKQPMRLTIHVGINYRRDASNCIKPIEDALCAFLAVPDDRYNDEVIIRRDPSIEGFAEVRLWPVEVTVG